MPRPPIELTVDQRQLVAAANALKSEADGKALRRDLHKALKATAGEPIARAKSNILSAPSKLTTSQSLRGQVANSIKPVSRLSGQYAGVSIRQKKTPGVRSFSTAGRRFNRISFRHKVYGRDVWVNQRGEPNWFDRPMHDAKPEFKRDVLRVVQELADTLAARAARQ